MSSWPLRLSQTGGRSAPCPACRGPEGLHALLSDKASQYLHEPLEALLESWRDLAFWSNRSFWDVLHVSCMVWGIRRVSFPVACRGMCAYSLCFPAVAAQVGRTVLRDSHDTAGSLTTLAQPVCPPDCCAREIPSPLPPCPSAASPWCLPALGWAQLPHGDAAGSKRDRPSSKFGWGSLTADPLPREHTRAVWSRTRASK